MNFTKYCKLCCFSRLVKELIDTEGIFIPINHWKLIETDIFSLLNIDFWIIFEQLTHINYLRTTLLFYNLLQWLLCNMKVSSFKVNILYCFVFTQCDNSSSSTLINYATGPIKCKWFVTLQNFIQVRTSWYLLVMSHHLTSIFFV